MNDFAASLRVVRSITAPQSAIGVCARRSNADITSINMRYRLSMRDRIGQSRPLHCSVNGCWCQMQAW
jgi:hypothetical protein